MDKKIRFVVLPMDEYLDDENFLECFVNGEIENQAYNGFFNFTNALDVVYNYAICNSGEIKIIATNYHTYIYNKHYNFYLELDNDFIYTPKEILDVLRNIHNEYITDLGEWKGDENIDGKIVRKQLFERNYYI